MKKCPYCGRPAVPDNVIDEIFQDGIRPIPYQAIIEDLNTACKFKERGKKGFSHKSVAHRRLIAARAAEGHNLDDFKAVHKNMSEKWLGDPKMEQYLRPSTLYCASKFEGYMNHASKVSDKGAEEAESAISAILDAFKNREGVYCRFIGKEFDVIVAAGGWQKIRKYLYEDPSLTSERLVEVIAKVRGAAYEVYC